MGIVLEQTLREIRDVLRDIVEDKATSAVKSAIITSRSSSASSVKLVDANGYRRGLIIVNTDANALYLRYGDTATAAADGFTVIVPTNGTWEMPLPVYTGRIDGIWAADGSGVAEITEM
jgi:hypothetical protein